MSTVTTGRARRIASSAVLVAVVVVAALASAGLLAATGAEGVVLWATNPICIAAMSIASIVLALATSWALFIGNPPVARWLGFVTGSLTLYLVTTALGLWLNAVQGHAGLVTTAIVLISGSGWVYPLAGLQSASLTVAEQASGRRFLAYKILPWVVIVPASVLMILIGEPPAPYSIEAPILQLSTSVSTALGITSSVLSWLWMASLVIVPIRLWVSVKGVRGYPKRRIIVAALAAVMPVAIITICEVLWLAFIPAGMTEAAGEVALLSAHSIGILLAGGLIAMVAARSEQRMNFDVEVMSVLVRAIAGLFFLIMAVSISMVLGTVVGGGAVFLVALFTIAIALAMMPLYRRVVRWLLSRADSSLVAVDLVLRASAAEIRERPADVAQRAFRVGVDDPGALLIVRDGDAWSDVNGSPATGDGGGQILAIDAEGIEVARLLYLGDPETAVRVSERLRDVIDRAVLELTVRAQQRRLTEERLRAETAVVDERHRMERDLHDGVQGKLLGLALNLQSAQRVLDDPQAQLVLDDAVHDLRGAIEELRLLASGQLPERLSRQGLGSALEVLLAKLPLDVDVSIPESRLPSEIETLAYFVIGEAVTNAAKHAACTRVAVEVTCHDESVRIRISDDGCGGADSRMGSGLKGLRERVHAAGGELMLREALPHGTELVAVVPLSRRSTATLEPSIVR